MKMGMVYNMSFRIIVALLYIKKAHAFAWRASNEIMS